MQSIFPADGAIEVAVGTAVTVVFSEAMDTAATEAAFSLAGAAAVPGSTSWSDGDTVLTFTPASALDAGVAYPVTVGTGATDAAGNALAAAAEATFTTLAEGEEPSVQASFLIDDGAATTASTLVALHVSSTGALEMRFGNSLAELSAAAWEPIANSKSWTLSSGAGEKTVYGEFRAGDVVVSASDSITYAPPVTFTGSLTVNGGDAATNFVEVTLGIDTDGALEMRFGADGASVESASWEPIAATRAWTLEAAEGMQTVYAQLRKGDEVLPLSASIYYNAAFANEDLRKLVASDAVYDDQFGYGLAMSADGRVMVSSSIKHDQLDPPFADAGQAYVFVESEGLWTEAQILRETAAAASEWYGRSVAVSGDGDVIAVGAMYKDGGSTTGTGAVFVYRRVTGTSTWAFEQKLTAGADEEAGDAFGLSVALSSDGLVLAVGATGKTVGSNAKQGKVYVFTEATGTWTQQAALHASDGAASSQLGYAMSASADGGVIAAGSMNPGSSGGVAYLYSGASWGTETIIPPPAGVTNNTYTVPRLSAAGDVLAVGSPNCSVATVYIGAVLMYTKSAGSWSAADTLVGTESVSVGKSGYSVALSRDGKVVASGMYLWNSNQGTAHVFLLDGGGWTESQRLVSFDGQTGDWFGYSVAISADGGLLAVGAYQDDTVSGIDFKGSVYLYD